MAALSAFARWGELAAGWAPIAGAGVAVGALAGAGQLGIGYGLGLLHYWLPAGPELTGGVWASQLTWVAWFAALAVLAGAAAASRVAWRHEHPLDLGTRVAAAVAAGIGGAVAVPLTALPARSVAGPGGTDAVADAVLAAGLGLVVGVLAAVAVLTVRLVAVSVTLLVAAVWLLALVSVAPSLAPTADLPDVRLAVLDLPAFGDARSIVAVLSPPALALLICGAVAAAARSRGFPPLLTAVSSAAAPGMLALTYLIGSPGTSDRAAQVSAYAGSLIALAAGLLVALLVGAVRLPSAGPASEPDGDDGPPTGLLPPVSGAPMPAEPPEWPEPAESRSPDPFEPPEWARPTEPRSPQPVEPPSWPVPTEPATPPAAPEPPEPAELAEPPFASAGPAAAAADPFRPSELRPSTPEAAAEPAGAAGADDPAGADAETTSPASTAELPVLPPERPSKRLRLPKLRRRPKPPKETRKEPAEPDEPDAAEPAAEAPEPEPAASGPVEPTSPAAPEPRPASAAPRPKRRGEVEHVDWISSLADKSEEEEPAEKGRRRLRRDRDLGSPAESLPDVPTWPANESPDPDLPPLHRPYVSGPDRSASADS